MAKKITSKQAAAQKELMLLWVIMTASPKYDPTGLNSAADIVDGISQEMQAASKSTSSWNWPNLTRDNALQFAGQAFPVAAKKRSKNATGASSGEFSDVIGAFQSARSAVTGSGAPWPPADGKTHPAVAEVATNLGLISAGN